MRASLLIRLQNSSLALLAGFGISGCTLFLIYIIMMARGGLDIMRMPAQDRAIIIVLHGGLILGVAGGIAGVLAIGRGENKLASAASIPPDRIMLCTCSTATLLMFIFNPMI